MQLTFNDILAPRGEHTNFASIVSGNITGTLHAEIDFISGTAYNEQVIDRIIDIDFGSGRATISTGDKTFSGDIYSGEILD